MSEALQLSLTSLFPRHFFNQSQQAPYQLPSTQTNSNSENENPQEEVHVTIILGLTKKLAGEDSDSKGGQGFNP